MTLKILTIDDSPTIRAMLDTTLTEAGFEVYQAENGRDGLGMLGVIRPDLVITDLNMSVMGGFTVIREIRQEKRYAGMPVLVMTTEGSEEGDLLIASIVEAGGACGLVPRHLLCELEASAVLEVGGDPGGAEGVAADGRLNPRPFARRRTMRYTSTRESGFAVRTRVFPFFSAVFSVFSASGPVDWGPIPGREAERNSHPLRSPRRSAASRYASR